MRNEESHFSVNPTNLDIGRSRFPRPFDHKTTFNVGQLIPFYWTDILPGDTVSMRTSKVVRMTTLIDPVMDNLYLDCYYFFVPMRLVWDHTREFFGENTSGPWAPSTTYTIPQMKTPSSSSAETVTVGSVADYMGVPTGVHGLSWSALPIRAYSKIYMDWFMDQMTMSPPNLYTGDNDVNYTGTYAIYGGMPYKAAKLHDYFSSSTPAPQRGPSVSLPISGDIASTLTGTANVVSANSLHQAPYGIRFGTTSGDTGNSLLAVGGAIDGIKEVVTGPSSPSGYTRANYTNLVADLGEVSGTFSADSTLSVNDLRMAFQMQKWYEKSAMYGGRYIEMLKAQFGVTSPDARLQRSEYLGGNRVPLNVTQVEANTVATNQKLGSLGAYSATSDYNDDFTHSFTEHGFLIGVCVARYKHSYPQGLERSWSRKTMFDYYFPVFSNIGNQPVLKKEIYAQGTDSDNSVWGYQEGWSDYRYHPDRVSAYMRPNVTGTLASWHYADNYSSEPFLSGSWMEEDLTNVDRTLSVNHTSAPQLFGDFYCDATFVRAMPLYSIPGLIDHH